MTDRRPIFITLHDGDANEKKWPDGRPIRVRADSIDVLRGYSRGRVRTVMNVRGSYYHVTETESEILTMIGAFYLQFNQRADTHSD